MKITDKNILIVSPAGLGGGKAKFTSLLLQTLSNNKVKYYHINNIRTRSNNTFFQILEHLWSFIYYKLLFIRILITRKVDIVQIHTSTYFDFWDLSIFIIIAKIFKKTTFTRYGGGKFEEFYGGLIKPQKIYIKWIVKITDKWIVQSLYWRDLFLDLEKKEQELFILPNFVDTDNFKLQKKKYNSSLKVLFIPGADLRGKGYYDSFEPITSLARQNPDIQFYIIGKNVDNIQTQNNIFIHKYIEGKTKSKLFEDCQIYLLPSYAEGFPNSLLEAMASGMAIITTNIPQIKSIVQDEFTALLINVNSPEEIKHNLDTLFKDKNKIMKLGLNARKIVEEQYPLSEMYRYLAILYNL